MTRNPDSKVKLDTSNNAGQRQQDRPWPALRQVENRQLDDDEDLAVKAVKTATNTIAVVAAKIKQGEPKTLKPIVIGLREDGVDPRSCNQQGIPAGPRGRTEFDCTELIENVLREDFNFNGIAIQNWSTIGLNSLWRLTECKPSQVTLRINVDQLHQSRKGLGFYVGKNSPNDRTRSIPAAIILKQGKIKDGFVEADFLLLGTCGEELVEFKPFFDDGDVHSWPSNNVIIK